MARACGLFAEGVKTGKLRRVTANTDRVTSALFQAQRAELGLNYLTEIIDEDFGRALTLNLPLTLVILIFVMGALLIAPLPIVVALNMVDIARSRGFRIDHESLSDRLGVPIVPIVATDPKTLDSLRLAIDALVDQPPPSVTVPFPSGLHDEISTLCGAANPAEALRILMDEDGYAETQFVGLGGSTDALRAARERLESAGVNSTVPGYRPF